MKKTHFVLAGLAVLGLVLASAGAQAQPPQENPATDIERGQFVHYPRARGGNGTGSATGDEVNDFKYTGIHWLSLNPAVTYQVNPDNPVGLNQNGVILAVQGSFQEWMSHEDAADGSEITFVNGGQTSSSTDPANPVRDGINSVSFAPFPSNYSGAIGITFYWYNRLTKGLVETDTVLNSDLPWSLSGDVGKYDLQNILTHEFGHWLVLGDLYSWRDSALTMYGYGGLGEIIKQTLGRGDISGINKAY